MADLQLTTHTLNYIQIYKVIYCADFRAMTKLFAGISSLPGLLLFCFLLARGTVIDCTSQSNMLNKAPVIHSCVHVPHSLEWM